MTRCERRTIGKAAVASAVGVVGRAGAGASADDWCSSGRSGESARPAPGPAPGATPEPTVLPSAPLLGGSPLHVSATQDMEPTELEPI